MTPRSPQELATEPGRWGPLAPGESERFDGYGVMGLPFASGHYLALRVFPSSSIGPGYRAVWHRAPTGSWTIYATELPEYSCARYFGAAASRTVQTPIAVAWSAPDRFQVTIVGVLDWQVRLAHGLTVRVLSRIGGLLPERAWHSEAVLSVMGPMAGRLLGAGRVALRGSTPNGQHYQAAPRTLWTVTDSSARLHGVDLGRPGPLARQDRLGDFWLPQRGIFAFGQTAFEVYDSARHRPATAGRGARRTQGAG
jgi:hypothetical protein